MHIALRHNKRVSAGWREAYTEELLLSSDRSKGSHAKGAKRAEEGCFWLIWGLGERLAADKSNEEQSWPADLLYSSLRRSRGRRLPPRSDAVVAGGSLGYRRGSVRARCLARGTHLSTSIRS